MSQLLPTSYFFVAIIGMIVVHLAIPGMSIIPFPWNLIGLVLLVAGIWLNLWADSMMKHHHTAVRPFDQTSTLIENGVFKYTRNPMYLGMLFILAGIAILFSSVTPWLFVMCFFIIVQTVYIAQEEHKLESSFGVTFSDYRKRVRRWL